MGYEVLLWQYFTWVQRAELLAYAAAGALQGTLVLRCYGGGVLDLDAIIVTVSDNKCVRVPVARSSAYDRATARLHSSRSLYRPPL